jgi:hypothetical protein
MKSIVVAACWLLPFAGAAFAQTDRSAITRTISDSKGGMIGGATIVATNTQTGAVHHATM